MNTTTSKAKTAKRQIKTTKPITPKNAEKITGENNYQNLLLTDIDLSPLNYRKYFDPQAMEDFARELAQHGVISPVTVRPSAKGRYELVAGERRWRAASLAGLAVLPAMVRQLTDEQVREIQLAENLQREDPHPFHEAQAIASLQAAGKNVDEIAARLGKSKKFVYSRIKLSGLIVVIQDIFLADKLTIQQAFEIAALSEASQYELYESYCTEWQEDDFAINNLNYILNRYKYDLTRAPFDTDDQNLIADRGACTSCPFNSATLQSLFPEMAAKAICTNKGCYSSKCQAQTGNMLREAVSGELPDALLYTGNLSAELSQIVESIPELMELPRYSYHDVTIFKAPVLPDREEYTDTWEEEEPEFDEDGFNQAMAEYHEEMEEYANLVKSDKAKYAILVGETQARIVLFNPEKQTHTNSPSTAKVTAKEVQQAIKAGTVTPELLQQEIDRINDRERRAKERDREKIQLALHEQFAEYVKEPEHNKALTVADIAAMRLVIYLSLDYSTINAANRMLFEDKSADTNESFFERLALLTEQEVSYLVRMAVTSKSESKYPQNIMAHFLYRMAEDAGLDVPAIEKAQGDTAADRQDKISLRIKDLEKKISKLQPKE